MAHRKNHHWLFDLGLILIVAGVYFLAAKLGLSLAFLNASVSPVWPPTGVAIALVFWLGYRAVPGVFLGALLANSLFTNVPFATTSGIAVGNTLEAVTAVYLLRRFIGSRIPFNRVIDVLKFLFFAVILSPAISATIGNISLCLGGAATWRNFGWLWLTWWSGDGVGALVVAPLILTWVERPIERWSGRRWAEGAALLLALWILSATIYTDLFLKSPAGRPWGHVTIPLLLWAAFRFGPRGVATTIATFSAIAIWGTIHGRGGFAMYDANDALLYLQAYVADLAITTLLLAAIISERKHAARNLSGGLSVTRILAESPALNDALPRIMQRICLTFDWEVGAMWIAEGESVVLRCLKVWPPHETESRFEAVCYQSTFASGVGLPGRVWQSLKPAWIEDVIRDENFPRARVASAEGLHAAFAFPIISGEKFLGVMEFFSHEIREPDGSLLAAFSGIGSQIGQFIERKRAEQALEPAKLLPSENPAPVIRLDQGRVLSYANPAALSVFASWKLALGKEVPEELAQHAEAALSHGDRRNIELPLGEQTYLVTLAPVVGVNYVNLYFTDITDLKRTQEALLKNEEWLRLTMEGGRMGTWSRDLDEHNRVVWSPELEEIFGLRRGEFPQTEEAFFDFVHPDDRERLSQAVRQAIESRGAYDIEFRYTRKDGAQRWMLGRGRAFYTEDGKPYRLAGLGWDITERKQFEEALRESQAQFANVIGSAMDAVITIDQDQRIAIFNSAAERMFGCSTAEATGRPIGRFIPEYREHIRSFGGTRVTRRSMGALRAFSGVRANGEEFPIEASFSQIEMKGQKLYTVILRDITGRKRAEAEREQLLAREHEARAEAEIANRIKDEFLATLSHELRTPLTAILGWLSIMRSQPLDPKTTEHAIATIERNARIQAQLIEDLVDVSRIVGGKLNLEMRPVDLLQVIEAAIEVVRPAAEAKGVALQVKHDPPAGLVSGDAARLQQVIWNLLSNAVKFTSQGGSVEVSLGRADGLAEVVVRDTGIGIAPEFLPHVFERFRQAESPLTRSHRGLGLGLAIVRHLVELHGGSVSAESPGENQGATFTIRLPRASALRTDGSATESDRTGDFDRSLAGLRVLVVEDDPDARELISLALRRSGAEVQAVASAKEALSNLQMFTPDVLLSDIGLPAESGYDLIREVRSLSSDLSRVPAIALTAFASENDRKMALATGFHAHLAKPVEPDHLIEIIRRVVRGNF
jgi:PAS domain S-box-containing protein